MTAAIEVIRVSKSFVTLWARLGRRYPANCQVLNQVDLAIQRGEIFGLLGLNGSGKTTLLKIISGLILPDSGQVKILGQDIENSPAAAKRYVGFVRGDERGFYWRLSVRENLRFFADLYATKNNKPRSKIDEILDYVDLTDSADKRFQILSSGQKQRLDMARSLLPEPDILLLDEPAKSLDPIARTKLHHLIVRLNREKGLTILLTTHNLTEAVNLCHRLAIIHHNRVWPPDTPANIFGMTELEEFSCEIERKYQTALMKIDWTKTKFEETETICKITFASLAEFSDFLHQLAALRIPTYRIYSHEPHLEEAINRLSTR